MRHRLALTLLLLVSAPAVSALSFTEDFESYDLSGFHPERKPDQDWYRYTESGDVGVLSDTDPIADSQSFDVSNPAGATAAVVFSLTGPTQLDEISFTIRGATPSEGGSRQFVQIQSQAPHRTLVEFYVFCTDAGASSACEFRVRFEHIDSKGQVLINTTVGEDTFAVRVLPDWTTGRYQLLVNGADDGDFPFMQLPSNIGRLRIAQDSTAYPLNATFDDLFIDGAVEAPATPERDLGNFIKDYATDIHFTTPTSQFLFGLWLFCVLMGAVIAAMVAVGRDNTTLPALGFFGVLVTLWLIMLEFWPDWMGLTIIILVAAMVSLAIRQGLMGIKDASTNAGIVAGALGYFIIATTLLGMSGYATKAIELPTSSLETPEDEEAQDNETAPRQSFVGGVAECLVSLFSDCSRDTVSKTWATITDIASTVFNFARTAFRFLFQLLTFQLPIPVFFNLIIVAPPGAALATVGFSFITRSGS